MINFICTGCKINARILHELCEERNRSRYTSDCDCQHRPRPPK